ncbi:MAG: hypothetical protein OXB88_02760 [Bacteriovoracales bacterium]|nr:hypothetical protein [Bacteriovoracales bacterium]
MRILIDILVLAVFSIAAFQGDRFGLEKTANFIQRIGPPGGLATLSRGRGR